MPNTFKFYDGQGRAIEGQLDRDTDTVSFTRTATDGVTVDLEYSGSFTDLSDQFQIALRISDTAYAFQSMQ